MAALCTLAISINSSRMWYLVELTRIELVTAQCHCAVIPLHYSPTSPDIISDFPVVVNKNIPIDIFQYIKEKNILFMPDLRIF